MVTLRIVGRVVGMVDICAYLLPNQSLNPINTTRLVEESPVSMSTTKTQQIRDRLDNKLRSEVFEDKPGSYQDEATQFFQDMFVELLNFEEYISALGDATWETLPVHEWPTDTRAKNARTFAKSGNFRVLYIELEELTRTAERNTIKSLTTTSSTGGWAIDGSFLAIFHAPGENIWHLLTPYEEESDDITTGRPILRRYTLGEGETHRTVASGLSQMDASNPGRLAERIDEAFRIQPVTEGFFNDYKEAFQRLSTELNDKGLELEDADQYAHTTLNRLMFLYYLQKKGWIGGQKDFIRWFHGQYESSGESETLHKEWLSALFFDGMNQPEGTPVNTNLPGSVSDAISDVPYMNGGLFAPTDLDKDPIYYSDEALEYVIQDFLEQYNFTITEESPYDIDVAVDPAMLGKIYESLIAEEDRDESGIFYTPRTEVDLICRNAVCEQLLQEYPESSQKTEKVVEFVFSDVTNWDAKMPELEQRLKELRIVDPACGSGAFLLGMVKVLSELHRKLGNTIGFERKRELINANIYGVDIKEWAVRVAEFRLWLALVENEKEVPESRPVLPNLSFNLKTGDSLIQRVGDTRLTVKGLTESPSEEVQRGITELEQKKRDFFEGDRSLNEGINQLQIDILKEHIGEMIRRRDPGAQQTLSGSVSEAGVDTKAKEEIEQLREILSHIESEEPGSFFMWELDFSEVMLEGGFDVVVGNPPYISNEFITDPSYPQEKLKTLDDERRDTIQAEYKEQLENYVIDTYNFEPDGQSDYYSYFFYKGIEVLKPQGTLSYITSDKWMDRGYGSDLQEFFLTIGELQSVIANRATRTFKEADITTTISTINKRQDKSKRLAHSPRFISCSDPYSQIVTPNNMYQLLYAACKSKATYRDEAFRLQQHQSARVVELLPESLWRLGGGQVSQESVNDDGIIPQGSYSGDKWGSMYLRAPDAVYDILEAQGERVGSLSEHGVSSYLNAKGAKKFYVVEQVDKKGDLATIRNKEYGEEFVVEREFLKPFLGSPTDANTPRIKPEDVGDARIVVIPSEIDVDEYRIGEYIQFGEEKGYNQSSGTKTQTPWWKYPKKASESSVIVLPRTHNNNHRIFYNPEGVVTGRFYRSDPPEGESEFVATVLNSTFGSLFVEIYGDPRGQGALDLYTADYGKLPVLRFDDEHDAKVPASAQQIMEREIGSVFEELGANTPEEVTLDSVKSDRRVLDQFVMGDMIGLSDEQQLDIYRGLLRLVDERLKKADSV